MCLQVGGLTHTEQKAHFALWCMLSAPLMLGNDPRTMTKATLSILTAPEILAISQDPLGKQAKKVRLFIASILLMAAAMFMAMLHKPRPMVDQNLPETYLLINSIQRLLWVCFIIFANHSTSWCTPAGLPTFILVYPQVHKEEQVSVWVKPLADGRMAALLFNEGSEAIDISLVFRQVYVQIAGAWEASNTHRLIGVRLQWGLPSPPCKTLQD